MKKIFAAMTAALLIAALGSSAVFAAKATSTWKVYTFNASGQSLRSQTAAITNGVVRFTFPKTPDAAYLLSTATPNLVGGLHATVGVIETGTTIYQYYPTGAPAMVGLYFETKSSGGFDPSDYWWSGSSRISLDSLVGITSPMSTSLDPANWTNYYGKSGDQVGTYVVDGVTYPSAAEGFNAAINHITSWGVSFGGGSFYANGVGTPTGSAIFTLTP